MGKQKEIKKMLTLFVLGYFKHTFDRGCVDLRTPNKISTRVTAVLKLLQHFYWSVTSLKKTYS